MNHTFNFEDYDDVVRFMNDIKFMSCKHCKKYTYHLICGLNPRFECLRCGQVGS